MTVDEVLKNVDEARPNDYGAERKLKWLQTFEAELKTMVLLEEEVSVPVTGTDELCLEAPWDSLYELWLIAMIEYYNGEYDRYDNSYALFNKQYGKYKKMRTTFYPTKGNIERGVVRGGMLNG